MSTAPLTQWFSDYRESVGSKADNCLALYRQLEDLGNIHRDNAEPTLELMQLMETLSADPNTVSCALLLAAGQYQSPGPDIKEKLPKAVIRQLGELEKLKHYEAGQSLTGTERSAEGLRRLLLALVKDVRVVLIDLSWQLVLLRHAKNDLDRARDLARETMIIHAPLANRLGVWQLKWELEDLSFRYEQPEQYQKIARLVAEHRTERERFIAEFMERLSTALSKAGIEAEVKGRPKHIFSIWKKMQRKGLDFHQLFDVRAVRVLVNDLPECYSALGLVHTLWQPIPCEG